MILVYNNLIKRENILLVLAVSSLEAITPTAEYKAFVWVFVVRRTSVSSRATGPTGPSSLMTGIKRSE